MILRFAPDVSQGQQLPPYFQELFEFDPSWESWVIAEDQDAGRPLMW